jgi:hypothetical protein
MAVNIKPRGGLRRHRAVVAPATFASSQNGLVNAAFALPNWALREQVILDFPPYPGRRINCQPILSLTACKECSLQA